MAAPRLVTVLPHEPLPPPSAGPGRIHLQGSLVPQAKGGTLQSSPTDGGGDGTHGGGIGCRDADSIAEALGRSLRSLFAATCGDLVSPCDGDGGEGLEVVVSSESKACACVFLPTQSLARTFASRLRRGGYSPRDLLASDVSPGGTIRLVDEGACPDGSGRYAGRALQVTHVAPAAGGFDPDDESERWGRAAPPKFRRLISNPASRKLALTAEEIEEKRRTTRFAHVDSVLGPGLRAEDVAVEGLEGDAADVLRGELSGAFRGRVRARSGGGVGGVSRNGAPVDDCRAEDDLRHSFLDGLRGSIARFDSSGRGVEVFLKPDMDAGRRAKPKKKKRRGGKDGKDASEKSEDGPARLVYDHLHLGMRSNADATRLVEGLQGRRLDVRMAVPPSFLRAASLPPRRDVSAIVTTGALYLDHADVILPRRNALTNRKTEERARGEPSKSECTSSTSSVVVPGLKVVTDHVSEEEERTMLAALAGPHAPWAPGQATRSGGVISRRVQHYGYVFDYETSDVLRRDADDSDGEIGKHLCPPLPGIGPGIDAGSMSDGDVESWTGRAASDARGWEVAAGVIERTRRRDLSLVPDVDAPSDPPDGPPTGGGGGEARARMTHPHLNQLTVNEYTPGQGIGGHVDTRTAFGDGLLIITLGGGTVMEFREVVDGGVTGRRKLVHLPPRSLAVLSGDARYRFEHMIVSRMTDTVDGAIVPRRLRVSLTLRTALSRPTFDPDDDAPFSLRRSVRPQNPLGRVETCDFPPRWGQPPDGAAGEVGGADRVSDLATPETERLHVHAVYDAIATQWHHTRGRRGVLWSGATSFLGGLEAGSVVADVGCGDGKYFAPILEGGCYVIGTDISEPLLRTAAASPGGGDDPGDGPQYGSLPPSRRPLAARPATAVADCLHLPLRSSSVDAAICIAVMHHLSTEGRRLRCLSELRRVVRRGGLVNVQAWALEQEGNERRRFHGTDVLVPFKAQPKYLRAAPLEEDGGGGGDRGPDGVGAGPDPGDPTGGGAARSIASRHDGAEYDAERNLVVFQRYCHMYRRGELEELVGRVDGLEVVGSSFERGNHVVTLRVVDDEPGAI